MIPIGTRFIGYAEGVNLEEKKSKVINSQSAVYTLDDVRGYKVYTALLTQSGGDSSQTISTGDLTVGVTYLIDFISPGMDFTNVGASNNNFGTYFVATGTTPASWGIDEGEEDILMYNTGAPVVTVLDNTIGDITWFYNGVGNYYGDLSVISEDFAEIASYTTVLMGTQAPDFADIAGQVRYAYINNAQLLINTFDYDSNVESNGVLFNNTIEIKVYN